MTLYANPDDEELELEKLFANGVPAQGSGGSFVPLPSMPLLRMPEADEESVAAAVEAGEVDIVATGEVEELPAEIEEISIGDEVVLPKGLLPRGETRSRVQWIDPKKKRLGVGKRRGKGYTFFSFEKFEKLSGRKLAADAHKKRQKDAREEGRPAPEPSSMPPDVLIPEGWKLYPHQIENVEFLWSKKRGLIADEMGLGKTASAIVALEAPAVVVCPSLLKVNWAREIARWHPNLSVAIIEGKSGQKSYRYDASEATSTKRRRRTSRPTAEEVDGIQQNADVVIINYDIIAGNLDWLLRRPNKTLVADEAHYLKTMDIRWNKRMRRHEVRKGAQRSKAFYRLQDSIERLYLLTGTPILNRVRELFPLLHMIDWSEWNSGYQFCVRYCAAHYEHIMVKGGRGRTEEKFKCDGRSNTRELHEKIKGVYMMRHTKEEELKEFPAKVPRVETVPLSAAWRKEYRRADQEFLKWLEEQGGFEAVARAQMAEALVRLNKLREMTAMGKVAPAVSWITRFFESTGRPLVVFALHLKAIEAMEKGIDLVNEKVRQAKREGRMPPISRELVVDKLIGGMTPKRRQQVIDDFQVHGKTDVLIYSIPIATGTTLTRAQDALFLERMWRPADLVQAEDRLHRIGQENTVFITYLDAIDTIDQQISKLLIEKSEAFAAVIDGIDVDAEPAARSVLSEILVDLPGFHQLSESMQLKIADALREGEMTDPLEKNRGDRVFVDPYEEASRLGITMSEYLGERAMEPNMPSVSLFDEDGEWIDDFEEDNWT